MVKTKGGRTLNPADAFRKEQRKKEVARNKIERKFIREGARLRSEPEVLKKELQEVIDIEEAQGTLPKNLKLKKKALQEAYDQAIKRKKEEELNAKMGGPQVPGTAGPVVLRPQDSPYYHPTLNPTGAPPPGKGTAPVVKAPAPSGPAIPVPKAPPLPAGPKPTLPPPPSAPPLPKGPAPGSAPHKVLPPPDEPPPPVLPPPDHPPPGYRLPPPAMPPPGAMMAGGRLPPPPGPPPPAGGGTQPPAPGTEEDAPPGVGSSASAQPGSEPATAAAAAAGPGPGGPPPGMPLPPPPGPPPGAPLHPPPPLGMPPSGMPPPLPPPAMPPPGMLPPMYHAPVPGSHAQYSAPALVQPHASAPPTAGPRAPKDPAAAAAATITGASTVAKRVPAEQNKQLLSMVPAALRVKRETAPAKPKHPHLAAQRADAGSGFGLAPRSAAPGGAGGAGGAKAETPASVDQRYLEFMASVADLGAFDS